MMPPTGLSDNFLQDVKSGSSLLQLASWATVRTMWRVSQSLESGESDADTQLATTSIGYN